MKIEVEIKVEKAFRAARDKAIAANGNTKFAEKEQMEVIMALIGLLVNDEEVSTEGTDAIAPAIRAVSNASSYAQALEKAGKIKRAERGTGGSKAKFV